MIEKFKPFMQRTGWVFFDRRNGFVLVAGVEEERKILSAVTALLLSRRRV